MNKSKLEKVSTFIDLDNVVDVDLEVLLKAARSRGRIVLANAYANFKRYEDCLIQKLFAEGIKLIHVPHLNNGGKSCVDEVMATDIADLPHIRREVDTVIIATGDGHFLPAVHALHRHGKKVVLASSPDSTNALLREAVDEFVPIPRISVEKRELVERIKELDHRSLYLTKTYIIENLAGEDSFRKCAMAKQLKMLVKEGVLEEYTIDQQGREIHAVRLKGGKL